MADYISREAAIDAVDVCNLHRGIIDALQAIISDIPSADVVEVVRCKDCRYFYDGYDEKCCINHRGVVVTDENGFCHHAERRDEDG